VARRMDDPPVRERGFTQDRERGFMGDREQVRSRGDLRDRRPLGRRGPLGLDPVVLALGGLALIALLAIAAYLATDRGRANGSDGPSVAAIADEPAAYYGKEVTITGEVSRSLGGRAFVLGEDSALNPKRVLVLGADALPVAEGRSADNPFQDGDTVQVSGPVRPFRQDELERDLGFDLDDATFADWENEPAIIATSVQLVR